MGILDPVEGELVRIPTEVGYRVERVRPGDPHEPKVVFQGAGVPDPVPHLEDVRKADQAALDAWCEPAPHGPEERCETYGKAAGIPQAADALDAFRRACSWQGRPGNGTAGWSSIGTPCDRKLAYKLAYGTDPGEDAWRAFVGTAIHAAADDAYSHDPHTGMGRWLTRIRVDRYARGEVDAYDRIAARVLDWKFPGITTVRRLYKGHVDLAYQVQLDGYGLELEHLGFPVHTVALLAVPPNGELADAAWYERPWDPHRAKAALDRRDSLNMALATTDDPRALVAGLPITEDHCGYCPVKKAGLCEGAKTADPPAAPLVTYSGPPAPRGTGPTLPPPPPGVGTNTGGTQ